MDWFYKDGFYTPGVHAEIPVGAVQISGEYHDELMGLQAQGCTIRADEHGRPVAVPPPAPTLEEVRAKAVAAIDAETSAVITAGFDYDINGETLHFSYDTNDQQNFADTGNAATLATMGVPGVPRSVIWNGWKVEKDADGAALSRSLVRLTLSVNEFLALYMSGALAHKAACMECGGQRKAAVEAAQTLDEIQALLGEG